MAKDYGEVLNTVRGQRCPDCRAHSAMTIHPEHRVYAGCGHSFPLPPIGITNPRRKRTSAKPKGVIK